MIRALVFAGGGSKGGYAAHRALRLANTGRDWSILGGESIGAANAYMAGVMGFRELALVWPTIRAKDIYRGGGAVEKVMVLAGQRSGIYDMTPSVETIRRLVAGRRIRPGIQVVVTVTDLSTGAMLEHILTEDTPAGSCVEKVYQSCLVPIAHGARDGRWADGGVSATAPMGPAVRAGAEHVDVVLLDRLGIEPWPSTSKPLKQGARAIEILRENLVWKDIQETVIRNERAAAGDARYRRVEATIYDPQGDMHDWMDWSPARAARWSEMSWDEHSLLEAYQLMKRRREEALAASMAGGLPGR